MSHQEQRDLIRAGQGFIAALDQSGGSTPKALAAYGVDAKAFSSDAEMFDMIHAMRSRIVRSSDFTGSKVVGAILFEDTMDRDFEGQPAPQYLWQQRGVVPFLKVDKGLQDTAEDVQLLKPMPDLDSVLQRAAALGIFGTKMRSVIHGANREGISQIVAQQFEIGAQIIAQGLTPIPRARDFNHNCGQARRGKYFARYALEPSRCSARRSNGDAQTHTARNGQSLQQPLPTPARSVGCRTLRRL
jgi:fructose-bisphosphate aldolase class I